MTASTKLSWLFVIASIDARHGGPPRGLLTLTRHLRGLGDDVSLLTMEEIGQPEHPDLARTRAAGVQIVTVRCRRLTRFRFSWWLAARAFQLVRRRDIVSNHGFYQWPTVVAYLAARMTRTPLFVQPHGVFEPYHEERGSRFKPAFMRIVGDRVLRYATFMPVATPSEAAGVHTSLRRQEVEARVVGMGVYRNSQESDEDRFLSRNVLFLSRIADKKRLDKLLDAARLAASWGSPFRVLIAGTGDSDLVERLKCSSADISGVEWLGHVDGAERRELESQCALLCLPSDNENFGQVVTEAMSAGLPVVTTEAVGAAMHVKAACSGWVLREPSVEDLAAAIVAALAEPSQLASLSAKGIEYATHRLSWESVAKEWRALGIEAAGRR